MIKYEHHRSLKKDFTTIEGVKNLNSCAHMHHSYEYVTVTDGKIKMSVGAAKLTLSKNDSALVLPGQIHSYKPIEGCDCVADLCIFSTDYLPELCAAPRAEVLHSPMLQGSLGVPSVSDIILVSKDKFLVKARLYELAATYVRGEAARDDTAALDKFASHFIDYLEAHYTEPITLQSVSAALGYNYRYLSGLVNRSFGTSFVRLISEWRVSYACNLLRESELTVTEICTRSGFESIRTFNRVFKQLCACTPSEYRGYTPPSP